MKTANITVMAKDNKRQCELEFLESMTYQEQMEAIRLHTKLLVSLLGAQMAQRGHDIPSTFHVWVQTEIPSH